MGLQQNNLEADNSAQQLQGVAPERQLSCFTASRTITDFKNRLFGDDPLTNHSSQRRRREVAYKKGSKQNSKEQKTCMLTEYEQNYSSYEQNNIDIDDFCTIVNGSVFMFFSCFSPIYSTQLLLSKTRFCRGATICWTSRNSSLTPGRQRCRTRFFKSLFLCKSQRFPQNMMDFKWLNHKSLYIYM